MRANLDVLLQLHHSEVRSQVNLGWRRMSFFLWTTTAIGIAAAYLPPGRGRAALSLVGAIVAALGAFVVRRGHSYYVGARDALQRVEREAGCDGFTFGTTPGQRGERRVRLRIVDAAVLALVSIAVVHLRACGP